MGGNQSQPIIQKPGNGTRSDNYRLNASDIHLDMVSSEGFKDDLKKISDIFKNFNEDNGPGLLEHIKIYNAEMSSRGKTGFMISDDIANSLTSFHEQIISRIQGYANKSEDDKNKDFFALLDDKYGAELEAKKESIIKSVNMGNSAVMKKGVDTIVNNVKALKIKYKFFEYKYIELNVFMILFIQYVYKSMDTFVSEMVAFNKIRDANREQMFSDAMNLMTDMLKDLGISSKDTSLNSMLTTLKKKVKESDDEMNKKMKDIMVLTTDNLSSYLNALTDTTKSQIIDGLKVTPAQAGGKRKKIKQRGGFVRDFSKFPQAFYDIEKIDLPPKPASSTS